ncbi:hypothetical protein B0T10DRAFT_502276 [Thelonectria olida]|uniref:Uncharacterized protein n=1 Tax=Thelonectria olida TaxID=1576542 RepID=A0A9P9AHU1_9HYPO|nr:hypothetical protein B0T10DRAFT_502276 [Thelonectria olida]
MRSAVSFIALIPEVSTLLPVCRFSRAFAVSFEFLDDGRVAVAGGIDSPLPPQFPLDQARPFRAATATKACAFRWVNAFPIWNLSEQTFLMSATNLSNFNPINIPNHNNFFHRIEKYGTCSFGCTPLSLLYMSFLFCFEQLSYSELTREP